MAEGQKSHSWWQTIPGTLTAIGGVITAVAALIGVLNQIGVFEDKTTPQSSATQPPVSATIPEVTNERPAGQSTDGWTIIGKAKQGRFFDLKLMIQGDSPAIGRSYDAVEDFRLVQKRPERGEDLGQVITLGMVQRGDTVKVLDLYIAAPSTETVPVWAKLRAVLHQR